MARTLLLLALAGSVVTGCTDRSAQEDALQQTLRRTVSAPTRPAYVSADAEGRKLWTLTRQFYRTREYKAAWVRGTAPAPQLSELITALRAAHEDGLDPQLYNVSHLEQRHQEANKGFLTKKGFEPREAGSLDAWLTYLYMKFASDLADGVGDLARADPAWQIRPERFDPAAALEEALATNSVAASLQRLTPADSQYRALREVLADYRDQASRGGWPKVPATLRLKRGDKSRHVGVLAARLAASGDYSGTAPAGEATAYTPDLQESVRRFQRRHGLADSGAVDAPTVAEMNVPLERRIRQIEMNLERWRWLPRELGDRYILVNIPEYRLEVWERGRVPVTMRVVVGKQDTQTPIFNDEMTYLVFSPYWNVPPDIVQGETLPAIMKDPGFLARTNMEVLDKAGQPVDPMDVDLADPSQYRFRQRPGTDNSLGLVKFMFPNQYNVYLHDTPADSLFARASRSFSHGCVRLEDPVALAQYVLRDQPEWTAERINEAMHALEEKTVKLREPLPVYLGYWTARVSPEGLMQFRRDIYGVDARLAGLLQDRLERLRKSAAAAALAVNTPDARRSPAVSRSSSE